MYSKRIEELSQKLKKLNNILDNTNYNPEQLEVEFLKLDQSFTDLQEKIEKETGTKFEDDSE
jgi:predicted  nucleic acid-binding Zn-ribbon protein